MPILFVLVATVIYSAIPASPLFQPSHAAVRQSGSESVQIFAGDCVTPQTVFNLGDTICVSAGGFPAPPDAAEHYRRITYADPTLSTVETNTVRSDPQFDRFRIPDTGQFARPGTWRVHIIDIETNARSDAKFIVRHPFSRLADLLVWKNAPDIVLPGVKIIHQLGVRNDGPDFAELVQFAEDVPTNATFLAIKQISGGPFECQTPAQGERGRILCTSRGLKPEESASFAVYYLIDEFARVGDTSEGTTRTASRTEELNKEDNGLAYSSLINDRETREEPSPEDP